jgi:type IV pilus assembly protein PilM
LIGYGKLNLPENTIIEGIISEPEKAADLLTKTFKNPPWGKITARRVYASLPESKMFTRVIELPKLDLKDIEEAIKYEMDQSIPIPSDDLYFDWKKIDESKDKLIVLLAAAPKSIINSYVQLFELLKMEPAALEMSMAAIARSMISNKNQVEPVLILDLGDRSSNIAVFDSNLKVTGSHPIGGGTIKELISTALSKSDKEAALLVRSGIEKETEASKIIKNEVDKLITEAKRTIDYYEDKNVDSKVKKILVCGGLGFLPGLTKYLAEKLKLEATVGNPWVNISVYPLKPVPKEEAPGYAAAIGLALRGINHE